MMDAEQRPMRPVAAILITSTALASPVAHEEIIPPAWATIDHSGYMLSISFQAQWHAPVEPDYSQPFPEMFRVGQWNNAKLRDYFTEGDTFTAVFELSAPIYAGEIVEVGGLQ